MPLSVAAADNPPPSVQLSFANNFWGKEDAGVTVLLERMHHAKITNDELKSFYSARTAIEEDYAKKLLSLARKPLGSCESGTLRMSLDVIRTEVEAMGKSHQNIAQQMRTELDEQLTAFAGGMKERRKIVQTGIEKLHKLKMQQMASMVKAKDRFEQDSLKIKGYLAQGHMVMGQEERKNKAKLEKTQLQLSTSQNEYEAAIKILQETTGRWNRDWKAACDKFQDLEEERIDFIKSSLWAFANIASTVCVSDDSSCEKIRLSLEDCDVEKDILSFIKGSGTGQEIPDAPKFINYCRGDVSDAGSDAADDDDDQYSVAQFQRPMNPAYRTSSPQPSTYESHHDPSNSLAQDMGLGSSRGSASNEPTPVQQAPPPSRRPGPADVPAATAPPVPHNDYPMDGMTQFCRMGPPSDLSSAASPIRPSSSGSRSEYSNPTSFSSQEPSMVAGSPAHYNGSDLSNAPSARYNGSDLSNPPPEAHKKKSGIFGNRSPFRRKSRSDKENPRNTWAGGPPPTTAARHYGASSVDERAPAEPVDPRANFQLNVGNNVFDVASPDAPRRGSAAAAGDELDPIAQALAELKGAGKQATSRVSADRYAGIQTPAPNHNAHSTPGSAQSTMRGRPAGAPPSYASGPPAASQPPPASHLGAPQPAFTSRQMQQTTQKYVDQKSSMFNSPSRPGPGGAPPPRTSPQSRPGTRGGSGSGMPAPGMGNEQRAPSPSPYRSTSPRPQGNLPRAASPNPYLPDGGYGGSRHRSQSTSPTKSGGGGGYPGGYGVAPARAVSPQPQFSRSAGDERPVSRNSNMGGNMAVQLAPVGPNPAARGRPMSSYGGGAPAPADARVRSKSMADGRQFTRDGRPILHFARALYMYQAAIPEELSFNKGDMLAVLRHQDDGWWEAEVTGKRGRPGLVPSNYLANA